MYRGYGYKATRVFFLNRQNHVFFFCVAEDGMGGEGCTGYGTGGGVPTARMPLSNIV